VNRALGSHEQRPPHLRRVLKQSLVNGALRRDDSPRVVTPPELVPRLAAITADWVARIEAAGYHVVGDLDELAPRPAPEGRPAARVSPQASRDLAVEAVAALSREVATLRRQLQAAERRAQHTDASRTPFRTLARRYLPRRHGAES
jgi:hypothetical protein